MNDYQINLIINLILSFQSQGEYVQGWLSYLCQSQVFTHKDGLKVEEGIVPWNTGATSNTNDL